MATTQAPAVGGPSSETQPPPDEAMADAEPESRKRKQGELSASAEAPDVVAPAEPELPADAGMAAEESESKRRKQDEGSEEEAEDADEGASGRPELRFPVGERVLCNVSSRSRGFLWKRGTVFAHWRSVNGEEVPYIIEMEDGRMAGAGEDDDECIRLAARAVLDVKIMRVFALPAEKRAAVDLRFMEGDRVALQLDAGIWEEGTVTEAWAVPRRAGKVLKAWAGLAVPYAVRLDLGNEVMVPLDTDEVIRAESAERPPQKSIAEQIGGTDRKVADPAAKRFQKRRNLAGQWVLVDTTTGKERACSPPDSDVDM